MKAFDTLEVLVAWLQSHNYVYYHAPMDTQPARLKVASYTFYPDEPKRNKVRLQTISSPYTAFTANLSEHLDRFRQVAADRA